MNIYSIIITTTDSKHIAASIQEEIIKNKLSPCVHIINNVESSFWWSKNIINQQEIGVIIKTRDDKVKAVVSTINNFHNYENPEIIKLDFEILNTDYLYWFNDSIKE